MARPSQIERHPERISIEMARMAGVSLDQIAERFGVSRDAVWRHMEKLPDAYKSSLIADIPREELARRAAEESGLLLDHFKMARNIAERQLIAAHGVGDSQAVAKLTKVVLDANEAIGRLTGEIKRLGGTGVTINNTMVSVVEQPEWRALASGLLEIANRFPQTKADIVSLIARVKDAAPRPEMIEGGALVIA